MCGHAPARIVRQEFWPAACPWRQSLIHAQARHTHLRHSWLLRRCALGPGHDIPQWRGQLRGECQGPAAACPPPRMHCQSSGAMLGPICRLFRYHPHTLHQLKPQNQRNNHKKQNTGSADCGLKFAVCLEIRLSSCTMASQATYLS